MLELANRMRISLLTTEGVDINVAYSIEAGDWGSFNLDYAGTILDTLDTVHFAGANAIKCVDFYAGQCGLPPSTHIESLAGLLL